TCYLVEQPDATAFLVEVDHDAAPLGGDHPHRALQLPAAVAASRAEDVAGETLRVHAHEHALLVLHVAVDESDVLGRVDVVPVADNAEFTIRRRNARRRDGMHETL